MSDGTTRAAGGAAEEEEELDDGVDAEAAAVADADVEEELCPRFATSSSAAEVLRDITKR